MNYNCLHRLVANGARPCDFVLCFLSDGEFCTWPLDFSVVFPVHDGSLVFLGYSRRGML